MKSKINYRPGNICRIYMKNFLTYDNAEIFLQPHLNVIVGPNGTGKSSILLAICIGLGGKPELTGRSKHLTEYVKEGKSSSTIEIELFAENGENIVIRREFQKDGSSVWHLDGRRVREVEVLNKVKSLNIQVNNLCQFLPQDRVKEFSILNKVQRLISTEKAVGEMELYEQHSLLSKFGKNLNDVKVQVKTKNEQLESEIQKNAQLEDQVKNIEMTRALDETIAQDSILLQFCHYQMSDSKFNTSKATLAIKQKEMKKLIKKREPHKDQENRVMLIIKGREKSLKDDLTSGSMRLRKKNEDNQKLYEEKLEQMGRATWEFASKKELNVRLEREILDIRKGVDMQIQQLKAMKPVDERVIAEQIREFTIEVNNNEQMLSSIRQEIDTVTASRNACVEEARRFSVLLKQEQDIRSQRLQILRNSDRNAYQAAEWLQENRNLFKGQVHDPIFTQMDFLNNNVAKYIECTVSKADLVAFVCENKWDVHTFKTQADSRGWRINILHSDPVNSSRFKPSLPLQKIRDLRFDGYLKDFINAPASIVSYLCRTYQIHNIPFSFSGDVDDEKLPDSIRLRYIGNKRHALTRSRYDGSITTAITYVNNPTLIRVFNDPQKGEYHKAKLAEVKERLQGFEGSEKQLVTRESEIMQLLERLRESLREKKAYRDPKKIIENSIQQKLELIDVRKSKIVDLQVAKRVRKSQKKKLVKEMKGLMAEQFEVESQYKDLVRHNMIFSTKLKKLEAQLDGIRSSMQQVNLDVQNKEKEVQEIEAQVRELERECTAHLNSLRADLKISNSEDIPKKVKADLRNKMSIAAGSKTRSQEEIIEVVLSRLEDAKEQRQIVVNTDPSILDEYNRREGTIAGIREELTHLQESLSGERGSYEDARNLWLPKINKLISNINEHFSRSMASLHCAGEVSLDTGSSEDDFANYGLGIRVKFRHADKLQEFSDIHQSGGERSLITALYLLALQNLTSVPFRCVDEINQGMDPSNERKMFTMLVDSTTRENASQYVLVTPKILPNLPSSRFVTYINTYNSPMSQLSSLSSFKSVVKYHRRRSGKHRKS